MDEQERVEVIRIGRTIPVSVTLNYVEARSLTSAARSWREIVQKLIENAELLGVNADEIALIAEGDLLSACAKLEDAMKEN